MVIQRSPRARSIGGVLSMAMVAGGCVGVLGDTHPPDGGSLATRDGQVSGPDPARTLGPAPMRRLNRAEYNNTVQDLFGITSTPADGWPADAADDGFDNDVGGQGPTDDLVEQIMRSAEQVGTEAVARLGTLLPCSTQTGVDAMTCGSQFIDTFAHRAYRRPLTDEDRARLQAILTWGVGRGGLATGVRLVITGMLQSADFLYRPESGAPSVASSGDAPGTVALSDVEIATRLSFLLVDSTPDPTLLAAAEAGQLHTGDQIRTQSERLLASPRGRAALDRFFHQWLPFTRLAASVKSATDFPQFDDATRDSMAAGLQSYVEHVVFDGARGDLVELMTANYTFADRHTAPLYGLTGSFGDTQQMAVPTEPRAGLLTQLGVMTALADNAQSSPVARGKFVFVSLMCQPMGSPPANLPAAGVPPAPDPSRTTRQRFDEHRTNPVCAGCHQFMDPLGFAFEHYDAIGRYRADENGMGIDATGQLTLSGSQVSFDGAQELSQYVAHSPLTRACFAQQWFTYAFGRANVTDDQGTLDVMASALGDGSVPIRQFLLDVTQRYAFTHRQVAVAAEACP